MTTELARFCECVLADGGFVPGEGLIVDGIRHLETIRELKRLVGRQPFKLLYVESSLSDRRARGSYSARDLENLDLHPVEAETAAVKNVADLVLDTTLLRAADCLGRLQSWAERCLESTLQPDAR